jgi:putative membrane protein
VTVPSTPTHTPPPGPGSRRSRFAEKLLPGGIEPDPRFTLANERTFLAWIRTSLALLAGGIAVEAFTTDVFPEPIRRGLSVLLLLLGMLLSAGSAVRWLRVEASLRSNRPLPLPLIGPLLAAGCAVAAAVVIAVIMLA